MNYSLKNASERNVTEMGTEPPQLICCALQDHAAAVVPMFGNNGDLPDLIIF